MGLSYFRIDVRISYVLLYLGALFQHPTALSPPSLPHFRSTFTPYKSDSCGPSFLVLNKHASPTIRFSLLLNRQYSH
jgi:hypothetical protein